MNDPLKAAFEAELTKLPDIDNHFTLAVLERLEKARLRQAIFDLCVAIFGATLLLAALVPVVTPLLLGLNIATWGLVITGISVSIGFYFVNRELNITDRLFA